MYPAAVSEKASCPGCGAPVPPTGVCPFCGASALVDGVAGKLLPSKLKCPRCPGGLPLQGVEHEGYRADFCRKCHGVWFILGMLEEVIRTAVHRPLRKGEGSAGPVHGGMEPVRYASCPKCGGGMARTPLSSKPLVIIDRCPSDGDWCDGGELSQLKAVARTHGLDEALGKKKRPRLSSGSDEVIEELKKRSKRGGSTGLITREVESGLGGIGGLGVLGGRRRRRRDLFDVLWDVFTR